jgi:hypothetical protein
MEVCSQTTLREFAEVCVQQTATPTIPPDFASANALQCLLCLPFWTSTSEFALINALQKVGQTTKPDTVFLISAHPLLTLTETIPLGRVLLLIHAQQNQ